MIYSFHLSPLPRLLEWLNSTLQIEPTVYSKSAYSKPIYGSPIKWLEP
jgi:hypothetical protein